LDLDEGEQSSFSLNTSADYDAVGNKEKTKDSTEGVNALRSISHEDVMKMVEELKENQEECDPNDPGMQKLYNEFDKNLTKDNVSAIN
jgi:dynactin complex subunit